MPGVSYAEKMEHTSLFRKKLISRSWEDEGISFNEYNAQIGICMLRNVATALRYILSFRTLNPKAKLNIKLFYAKYQVLGPSPKLSFKV